MMRMTEREALTILAAWLRSADESSFMSPSEVEFAIGVVGRCSGFAQDGIWWVWDDELSPPPYTRDFHAAYSLVPGDCRWTMEGEMSSNWCEVAYVWSIDEHDGSRPYPATVRADMNGPVAALAAAAMKARWRARQNGRPILPAGDAGIKSEASPPGWLDVLDIGDSDAA